MSLNGFGRQKGVCGLLLFFKPRKFALFKHLLSTKLSPYLQQDKVKHITRQPIVLQRKTTAL